MRKLLLIALTVMFSAVSGYGMQTDDIMIPMAVKGLFGTSTYKLAAYIHKPDNFDPTRKYPVVIINHGTSPSAYSRTHTRARFTSPSQYFINRGFIVVVPMRRGYAGSDGASIADESGPCDNTDYSRSAKEASLDVAAVIVHIRSLRYIDPDKILLAGVSTGGVTTLATASLNIDGVRGAINFAGGRGGSNSRNISGFACSEGNLIKVMGSFGVAKVPTLWLYSINDTFFRPELAKAMFDEFIGNGGKGTLIIAPPFGHTLFGVREGRKIWAPYVDNFLDEIKVGNGKKTDWAAIDDEYFDRKAEKEREKTPQE